MAVNGRRAFALNTLVAACFTLPASAQSPLGSELLMSFPASDQQFYNSVECDTGGNCMVIWDHGYSENGVSHDFLGGTTVSSTGAVLAQRNLRSDDGIAEAQIVWDGKYFRLFWEKSFPDLNTLGNRVGVFQRFDRFLTPKSLLRRLPYANFEFIGATDASKVPGGYALLSAQFILSDDGQAGFFDRFLFFVDEQGRELHAPIRVAEGASSAGGTFRKGLAGDAAGNLTVCFARSSEPIAEGTDVFIRRFTKRGDPLSPDIQVNLFTVGEQMFPAVSAAPQGEVVVAWQTPGQDGDQDGIFARRYSRLGVALGPEFQVNNEADSAQRLPHVASDKYGNFVVVWQSFASSVAEPGRDWDVKARLFRSDGSPVADEILVNQELFSAQEWPDVVFAANGTFIVVWNSHNQVLPDSEEDVFARRYSASPGDEVCIASTGRLRCDTGRTGRSPEGEHFFGGASAGLGLLGDVDGDGRADPCDYTNGIFRCDTDHQGGAAELRVPFVAPADLAARPLLGDVDGDGDADPCLYSAGRFYCDTAHNGGVAEVVITAGDQGEALLGDLDGDGRDDPCFFQAGRFRCAQAPAGSQVTITFGKTGDLPLLGDWDGDGRDDPCVFRKGFVMCDTAHNGGPPETTLRFGENGDRLVLGNLDGL